MELWDWEGLQQSCRKQIWVVIAICELRLPYPASLPRGERGSIFLVLTRRPEDYWLRLRLWSFPMDERNIGGYTVKRQVQQSDFG